MNQFGVDLEKVYRKVFWVGIVINILFPIALIIIAFLHKYSDNPNPQVNIEQLRPILYAFIAVSLGEIAVSLFFRRKRFFSPMIKSKETFEKDFSRESFNSAVIVNSMITAIAIYGLIFFFMSGRIEFLFYFGVPSIIAYFLIRPDQSLLEKSLDAQEKFVSEGKYFTGPKGPFGF